MASERAGQLWNTGTHHALLSQPMLVEEHFPKACDSAVFLQRFMGALVAGVLMSGAAAQAQSPLLPLPQLAPCAGKTHPRLPEKWRGVFLMAPFDNQQLVLAEIVSDSSLSAMRVKLHGLRRGSLDLLVRGKATYVLNEDDSATTQCRALGNAGWRPLPTDWLAAQSRCVGEAPIGATSVAWWKTAVEPEPASYWVWHKTSDQTPFRLVFSSASDRLPPFSRFALSYQVSFQALDQTDLGEFAAACKEAGPARTGHPARALRAMIVAMAQSRDRSEREINRLMPEISTNCPAVPFPEWPAKVAITGLMTPVDSDENPYPAEVLYDWSVPAQRTRTYGGPNAAITAQDSLLLDPRGYTVTHYREKAPICRAVLPGTIRPDWTSRAPCECAATINGTTPLSPHGTTQIFACPLASPRVAWAWYTLSERPLVFMVTSLPGDEGKRLFAVLDYREWLPGHSVPRAVFDKPAQCTPAADSRASVPPAWKRCSTCHLGREPPR